MRKSFSSHMAVAHAWAHQQQPEGYSGNVYFFGETIYSYGSHYELAKVIKNAKGQLAYVLNSENYSNSTSGHLGAVRSAIPSGSTIFYLGESSLRYWGSRDCKVITDFAKGVKFYVDSIKDWLTKQRNAVSRSYDYCISNAVNSLIRWCKFHLAKVADIKNALKSACKELAKLLLSCIKSEAIDIKALFVALFDEQTYTKVTQRIAAAENRAEIRKKEREAIYIAQQEAARLKDMERLELWHENSKSVPSWSPCHTFCAEHGWHTALRVSADGSTIQTSKNIRLSKEEGFRLWKILKAFHDGTEFRHEIAMDKNGHGWKFCNYENDVLTAGCHKIPFSEMKRIADIFGWQ